MTVFEGMPDNATIKSQHHIYENDILNQPSDISYGSLVMSFIRQLRPGMDVSRIQAPIYIVKPKSYLETTSDYVYPTEALVSTGTDPDPESRMRTIVAWCLSNLEMTAQKGFNKIKPYNPVLGEKFTCDFEHADKSVTVFKSEQVSHHPPISAIIFENKEHNISYTSTSAPKSTFWGNRCDMILDGIHYLHLHDLDEHYKIQFPPVIARGIIFGSSVVEHSGTMIVECEKTGYRAAIEFKNKYLNYVDGFILKNSEKVVKVCGTLDQPIPGIDVKTKTKRPLYDPSIIKSVKRNVRPVYKQDTYESRRLWHAVSFALSNDNLDTAQEHKIEIEEWQRRLRKEREEREETWKPDDFVLTDTVSETEVPMYKHINKSAKANPLDSRNLDRP